MRAVSATTRAVVLDSAGVLIVVTDRDGRIERFNRAAEKLTSVLSDDALGEPLIELLVPAERRETVREEFSGLDPSAFPRDDVVLRRHRTGSRDLAPPRADHGRRADRVLRARQGQHISFRGPFDGCRRPAPEPTIAHRAPTDHARAGRRRQRHQPPDRARLLARPCRRLPRAAGGAQALAMLEAAAAEGRAYHVVVLDSEMPELSGADVVRTVRMAPALRSCRIVILTSAGPGPVDAEVARRVHRLRAAPGRWTSGGTGRGSALVHARETASGRWADCPDRRMR